MKKYLMILSSITAIGGGTIVNAINTANPKVEQNQKSYADRSISTDFVNYDITDGSTAQLQLTDSLTLFKSLHNFHKENNVDIKFTGVPGLILADEYGNIFLQSPFQNMSIIYDLINSESIEFKENILEVSSDGIKLFITYKIGDVEKTDQLDYAIQSMPLKMVNMQASIFIPWTY